MAILCVAVPWRAAAQGGPPYYTNDPGTPGNRSWEINVAYMPFLFNGSSTIHVPDLDINYGVGDRIQLTYENAWLRVKDDGSAAKYGLGQDQLGVKWRFVGSENTSLEISVFPQVSLNNLNHSVQRGITPLGKSITLPVEISKRLGPLDFNLEVGYNIVDRGPNSWLTGLVVGRDLTRRMEWDVEFYGVQTDDHSNDQRTIGSGLRYKMRPPFVLLMMAGRSVTAAHNGQPFFVGYIGMQILLPVKPFESSRRHRKTTPVDIDD